LQHYDQLDPGTREAVKVESTRNTLAIACPLLLGVVAFVLGLLRLPENDAIIIAYIILVPAAVVAITVTLCMFQHKRWKVFVSQLKGPSAR
jgi:membrane protein YdbS with pleckstrin-like domain